MPDLARDPVKKRFDALMEKAQGTGQRIGWVGEQVTPNPVLDRLGRVGFPFGKITCYSMKMGLVPLAKGLVPVLKENIIWLRRKIHRNARRLILCPTGFFCRVSAYQSRGSKFPHVEAQKLGPRATGVSDSLKAGSLPESPTAS